MSFRIKVIYNSPHSFFVQSHRESDSEYVDKSMNFSRQDDSEHVLIQPVLTLQVILHDH